MSGILLVLLIIAGLMFVWLIGWGLFVLLLQAGVIVQAAATPPTTDAGDYTLSQGQEVKGEQQ